MSDVFDKVAYSFLMPGDPDDQKVVAVQTTIDPMPPVIHQRLRALYREVTENESRRTGLRAEVEEDREIENDLIRRIGHLDRQERHGAASSDATVKQREDWQLKRARLRDSINEREKQIWYGGPRVMPYSDVVQALEKTPGPFTIFEAPTIPAGETAMTMLAKAIAEIAKLDSDTIALLKTSPLLDELKDKIRNDVEWRAAQGEPDISPMLSLEKRDLSERESYGRLRWQYDYELGALTSRTMIDICSLSFWLHKDAIIARLFAQLEERYDPTNAMSSADRMAALAKVKARILELDYEACAYVWMAKEAGVKAQFRLGCSPLAVLGLLPAA